MDTVALDNAPVPSDFNGPADSAGGRGSFHFGPIGMPNNAKQETQPPETKVPVNSFQGDCIQYINT